MNEEYLWNGEGDPDPEIARMERLLRRFQHQPDPSFLQRTPPKESSANRRPWFWISAVAAGAAVLIAISWDLRVRGPQPSEPDWKVSWNDSKSEPIRRGQIIETGKESAARLEAEFVGEVRVDPHSRLKLLRSTNQEQRLSLERGTIHAFIWAPPREFVVDTPSATTIDLGCRYTLHIAPDGTGLLNVEVGWVAFEWRNLESFIPAGAACSTRPSKGPGLPYFDDAASELRTATAQFDKDAGDQEMRRILQTARPRDALTLWHLLSRTQGAERTEVFARFSELVKLPSSVTREKILNGDPAAFDAAWNALDLGDTDWWRGWKRRW